MFRGWPQQSGAGLNICCACWYGDMMSQNNALIVIGALLLVVITAGLTYYITESSGTLPPAPNATVGDKPIITVRGEATRTLEPDLLTVSLSIESFGNDTAASQAQSAADTADVKAGLLAAGVKSDELETGSYYTYPVYNGSCYHYSPYYDYAREDVPVAVDAYYPESMPYPRQRECVIIGYKTVHELRVETS